MTDDAFERRAHTEILRLRTEIDRLTRENQDLRQELMQRDDALYAIGKILVGYEEHLRSLLSEATQS